MLPGGELYHVDSLIAGGEIVFATVSKHHRPLLEVYQDGGIFASRTLAPDHADAVALRGINARLLKSFRLGWGCSHTEFMRASDNGQFYFIETSSRVGGASISDMVEAATGSTCGKSGRRSKSISTCPMRCRKSAMNLAL
jgi:Biotin carboxylase